MPKILWAWIATVALACVPVRAEEIQLKDGTKVTGKLTGITNDAFQVKTAYGDIQVPRAQVISINFPQNQPKKESDAEEPKAKSAIAESLNGTAYTNVPRNFTSTCPKVGCWRRNWLSSPRISQQR
jgi:hypothetical protein